MKGKSIFIWISVTINILLVLTLGIILFKSFHSREQVRDEFETIESSHNETSDTEQMWNTQESIESEMSSETFFKDESENLMEEIEETEEIAQMEWEKAYSNVIDSIKKQENEENMFFLEKVFISHEKSSETIERGGVAEQIPVNISEIYYYLKDLDGDGIPELCIGAGIENKEILAIYSYSEEKYCARLCLNKGKNTGTSKIFLCEGGMALKLGETGGGELYLFTGDGTAINFAAYREEQDAAMVIDSNSLEWKSIFEW